MTRLTLNRIAIKGISQHKTPFIAKLPHANLGSSNEKRHFRVLFHQSSVTNFCTKNQDKNTDFSQFFSRVFPIITWFSIFFHYV